ncbi:phosphate butyryltransferase [Bacillaceae bacterium S4-13-56]
MNLKSLLDRSFQSSPVTVAVAQAADSEVILAIKEAVKIGLASFILIGDEAELVPLLNNAKLDHKGPRIQILHQKTEAGCVQKAVEEVREGRAQILMKGNLQTKTLLQSVLNRENGLRNGKVLSHVSVFEFPTQNRLFLLTDAAMNVAPSLKDKTMIVQNAVEVARSIGIQLPKVAPLAAVEVVNESMPASVDAALLSQMQKRGQIADCIIDGPLAFDIAISKEAALHKKIESPVAGEADILLVPTIEVGNALYKSFVYFAQAKVAGIIYGAKSPIVLTSRADSAESKLYSLALAICSVNKN